MEKPHTSMGGEPFVVELLKCRRGRAVMENLGTGMVGKGWREGPVEWGGGEIGMERKWSRTRGSEM